MGTGGALIVIDFTQQGNSAHFRGDGWSGQETDRVWGIGPRSVLSLPFQPADRQMVLEAEVGPLDAPPLITGQLVRIRVNGSVIGSVLLETRSLIRCEIDPALIHRDGGQEIAFEFPGFFCAASLPESGDDRPLSGWFSFVRCYTTDMFKAGPWFPASRPDIPVITPSPPFAMARGADAEAAPVHIVGSNGSMTPSRLDGWDTGEDGVTWTVASVSHLDLPGPLAHCSYVLRIDASPLIVPGMILQQNVTVLLDGIVIGQLVLREPASWILPLPVELTGGKEGSRLSFILPDAIRPGDISPSADTRLLGIAVSRMDVIPVPVDLPCLDRIREEQAGPVPPIAASRRFATEAPATLPAAIEAALGIDVATLLRGFESLGTNRAFGIVQRKLDFEVLNLFRFSEVALPDLVKALSDDLRALTDPDRFAVEPRDDGNQDYVLTVPEYAISWPIQTHDDGDGRKPEAGDQAIALGYLRRKFYEGLRAGRKIYVVNRRRTIPIGEACAVLGALGRHGGATLLCVEPAADERHPGQVELLAPGLMRGYVDRYAPDTDVESADPTVWLRVLANAALLNRGQ